MEDLFWQAAGPLIGDDEPSAVLLAGMMVCAADGMLVNLADTPANRAMFGCTGTASRTARSLRRSRSCRIVALTARAGRAMLGAILGSSRAGEQTLLKRLVRAARTCSPAASTCFDRNFRAPRGALTYRPRSGHGLEEVSVGLMAYLDP